MPVLRTFGENLRRFRLRRGYTQAELAHLIGLRRPAPVSLWETGTGLPRPETIIRMAAALECTPAELLLDVETPYDRLRAGKGTVHDNARAPSERSAVTGKRASSA